MLILSRVVLPCTVLLLQPIRARVVNPELNTLQFKISVMVGLKNAYRGLSGYYNYRQFPITVVYRMETWRIYNTWHYWWDELENKTFSRVGHSSFQTKKDGCCTEIWCTHSTITQYTANVYARNNIYSSSMIMRPRQAFLTASAWYPHNMLRPFSVPDFSRLNRCRARCHVDMVGS